MKRMGAWSARPSTGIVHIHDDWNADTGTRTVTPCSRARKLARDRNALYELRPPRDPLLRS